MTIIYYIAIAILTPFLFSIFVLLYLITMSFDSLGVWIHKYSRLWTMILLKLHFGWKIEIEGLENIDKNEAYVITVNHQSMIDVPLMYVLPLNFKWVAKTEVYKVPIFGWMMRMHRDITIKRGSHNAGSKFIADASRWISRGVSVVVFPEGTRSKNGNIRRFKDGSFFLAKNANISILPCVMDGSGDALINSWKLRIKHKFTIKILPPISKETVESMDVKELTKFVRMQMVEAHDLIVKKREQIL